MGEALQLRAGTLRCEVIPELGGAISGLWLGDTPVLRSTPAAELKSVREAGSYPLVPFSNRIAHATLQWEGTNHPLVRHVSDEPHAIHGVGWQRPWQVLEAGERFALLSYEHKPDAAWPFAFDCSQALRMDESSLSLSLSVTNQSQQEAPFGLGWHPYFVKRARSRIAFEAAGRWEMSDDKLPTHRSLSGGLNVDCAMLDVDHCFDGWTGHLQLRDELMHVHMSSNLHCLVVFTNDRRDFVAIEPVSHVNNAINLGADTRERMKELGVRVLRPGETLSAEMRIDVEHVH